MRTIAAVTVGRSDYGIYRPLFRKLAACDDVNLKIFVGGAHLLSHFGNTATEIENDGFAIAERVEMLLSSDSAEGIGKSIGLGVASFAQLFGQSVPDLLITLGDRFEMFSAVIAAVAFKLPVAHLHGGEVTHGAIDDSFRHSMTKMSHLHFVSTDEHAQRVMQMGEEPWRVHVCGALALDNLATMRLLDVQECERRLGIEISPAPVLVTYHPVTLEYENTEWQIAELLNALDTVTEPLVFTLPNADTSSSLIRRAVERYVGGRQDAILVANLGTELYFSLMACASLMIGNSSSGIIEAPSFGLPVVNIGNRQGGRACGENVIHSGYPAQEIKDAVRIASSPEFRMTAKRASNPFSRGGATDRIVQVLRTVPLGDTLTTKQFIDLPAMHSQFAAART